MDHLNYLNYLNLIGYIINSIVTFFVGSGDNAVVSAKYQTIVTPAGYAFSIWGIIFIFQFLFILLQLTTKYSQHPLVQEGVKYWYFGTCITQALWSFAFNAEQIILSVVIMMMILFTLILILISQAKAQPQQQQSSRMEFWLLKFPFAIHCGWILAAFAVNVNVIPVSVHASGTVQAWIGGLSLLYIVIGAAYCLFSLDPVDYTIPSVFAWATLGIAIELRNPKELILNTFDMSTINLVKNASAAVFVGILLGIFIRIGMKYIQSSQQQQQQQQQQNDSYANPNVSTIA